jgi:hypothetical protein
MRRLRNRSHDAPMIDSTPPQPNMLRGNTVSELAAAIAERIALLYLDAGTELAKRPPQPRGELLLSVLLDTIGDVDDVSGNTSGNTVREVLDNRESEQLE